MFNPIIIIKGQSAFLRLQAYVTVVILWLWLCNIKILLNTARSEDVRFIPLTTAQLWRESAALNSWGCTLQRISPGPPTSRHSTRRDNSTSTFSTGWKGQVSLQPSSPLSTGESLRVCWPPASLSGMGTAVLLTARPYNGQWTLPQRSSVPLSPPSWTFSLHDAPARPPASWRTPPIPLTTSSSSCHQVEGTGVSKLALLDCSTAFSPRLWELLTPISLSPAETINTSAPSPPTH